MTTTETDIYDILESVSDPEIPVVSIMDLGIVRAVHVADEETVEIVITPTYSGCPAMSTISMDIRMKLLEAGFKHITIKNQLSPAWTTDWFTEKGKQKLREYGIAPPVGASSHVVSLFGKEPEVHCPLCGSAHTEMVSRFGSTSCKAHYRCNDCHEPFDYFKCH